MIIKKIKDLTISVFQQLKQKVRGDGNCLPRAILRSIEENELEHLELGQIIVDNVDYENL